MTDRDVQNHETLTSCIDLTLSSPRFGDGGGQRDSTTGHLFIDLTLSSPKFDDEGGQRTDGTYKSKNTLGRSVPVKTMTDVEDDGTPEDGSPRHVCSCHLEQHNF